jgi:hypothetical protein
MHAVPHSDAIFSKKDNDALKEQNYGIWHRRIYFALAFRSAHSDFVYNFSLARLFLKIGGAARPRVECFRLKCEGQSVRATVEQKSQWATDAHHLWQLDFIDLALAAGLMAKVPPRADG